MFRCIPLYVLHIYVHEIVHKPFKAQVAPTPFVFLPGCVVPERSVLTQDTLIFSMLFLHYISPPWHSRLAINHLQMMRCRYKAFAMLKFLMGEGRCNSHGLRSVGGGHQNSRGFYHTLEGPPSLNLLTMIYS